jgi:hypothetical protein
MKNEGLQIIDSFIGSAGGTCAALCFLAIGGWFEKWVKSLFRPKDSLLIEHIKYLHRNATESWVIGYCEEILKSDAGLKPAAKEKE